MVTLRPANWEDVINVCGAMNSCGVEYIITGGFAFIANKIKESTFNIDISIFNNDTNKKKICEAFKGLDGFKTFEINLCNKWPKHTTRIVNDYIIDIHSYLDMDNWEYLLNNTNYFLCRNTTIPILTTLGLFGYKSGYIEKDLNNKKLIKAFLELLNDTSQYHIELS